jgi:hypothetical protein
VGWVSRCLFEGTSPTVSSRPSTPGIAPWVLTVTASTSEEIILRLFGPTEARKDKTTVTRDLRHIGTITSSTAANVTTRPHCYYYYYVIQFPALINYKSQICSNDHGDVNDASDTEQSASKVQGNYGIPPKETGSESTGPQHSELSILKMTFGND